MVNIKLLPGFACLVKAYNEIQEFRNEIHPNMPWIMHGYNSSIEQSVQMAKMGIMFSFGENLYRPNSKAVESFRHLPLEKIFFETKVPLMSMKDLRHFKYWGSILIVKRVN